jgi:hypothetical protein
MILKPQLAVEYSSKPRLQEIVELTNCKILSAKIYHTIKSSADGQLVP